MRNKSKFPKVTWLHQKRLAPDDALAPCTSGALMQGTHPQKQPTKKRLSSARLTTASLINSDNQDSHLMGQNGVRVCQRAFGLTAATSYQWGDPT